MTADLMAMLDDTGTVRLRFDSPAIAVAAVPLLRDQLASAGRSATFRTAAQYVFVSAAS